MQKPPTRGLGVFVFMTYVPDYLLTRTLLNVKPLLLTLTTEASANALLKSTEKLLLLDEVVPISPSIEAE